MRPSDPGPHPESWATTTVGEDIELRRGLSWEKRQESAEPRPGRVPVVRIGNVQDSLMLDDLLYLSDVSARDIEQHSATAGWSLMVGSNGNRQRVGNAVLLRNRQQYLFASFLVGARPRADSRLEPDYFYRWLASERVQAYLSASSEGTTGLNNLSHSFFRSMTIPVPGGQEQAAICAALDAADEVGVALRRARDCARDVKRALVQAITARGTRGEEQRKTPIGRLPRSWEVVPLREVVLAFQYGLSLPMSSSGDMPILRMGNIQDGDVLMRDLKFVSLRDAQAAPYIMHRGDVLFNRTNSQEWVGKVGVYRSDAPAVFASYIIRLHHNPALVDPYFLGHVLAAYPTQCRIKRYATPGVQQVNINATNLGKVLIPLPTGQSGLEEQRESAAALEAAHAFVRSYDLPLSAHRQFCRSLSTTLLSQGASVPENVSVI